ncbi:MAG: penicillin-binding protein 2 [Alphaproteobacteria bacterium]|jgi:penicillin-binding protein 2|uniref:penicillin-binding protein 2 n=1 Tax=Loktanella salsilacus TaxID=195913 RepID=UPI001EB305F2|nr:penicillin-binding protein 2 [Alphaproteobacteria bacterium]MBU0861973.1 penicillin-binding protein 2 [Alphaproteobacteria bacterium]MBU1836439.1 penicillin-binding protein 2 [Alphaproteobacteria bacterium]
MTKTHIDPKASPRLTRRGMILGAAQLTVVGALGLRMHTMQIDEADTFRTMAEENRISMQLIAPPRGRILDRFGAVLADNRPTYQVTIVRERAGDAQKVLAHVQMILGLSDDNLRQILEEMADRSSFVPITVAKDITWDELSQISINAPALPGVSADVVLQRVYPFGTDFAHIVGYVGRANAQDVEDNDGNNALLAMPGFHIGKISVEKAEEASLRGTAGRLSVEVNAAGRVMRSLDQVPPVPGADLQLTIDHHLQNFTLARLAGQSAAAVVIDVQNGDLLACASAPTFDPNLFVDGISSKDYNALRDDPYRPLSDKVVQGAYPPGSVLKMSLALAALEGGQVSPDETVYCPGFVEIGGRRFHCWKRGGHGRINLRGALRESCDVFFYETARRVGIDNLHAMSARLGLGERPDLPLSGIASGLNPSREWKMQRYGKEWLIGDTINASIGQGFVLATPMQLAIMAARIASGKNVIPRLFKPQIASDLPGFTDMGLAPASLALVHAGMTDVVNAARGTAKSSRIVAEGQAMAGKTGSSQVFSITAAERAAGVRSQADLPWDRRDHALFTAFAPIAQPRIAVSVLVEHGGGGSLAAAPIARDLVLFHLNGGLPPVEAYPADQRGRMQTSLDELSASILPIDRHAQKERT